MQRFAIGPFSVARIGFGAMQLPGPGVFGPPRDHDQAVAVLRRAVELGVDHIDTAQFYGPNVANELIREALQPYPNDGYAEAAALAARCGGHGFGHRTRWNRCEQAGRGEPAWTAERR